MRVAGVDEVGRGCLAGPVVAAAVIFDSENLEAIPEGIRDSKLLSAAQRERLAPKIEASALCFAIGVGSVEEIDAINILQATRLAMHRAVEQLNPPPQAILVDGNMKLDLPQPQEAIVSGDRKSVSIAAASVLAKVYRDRLMAQMDALYPGYFFARHKGYGSLEHRKCLQELGQSPIHRKSFRWSEV